MVTFKAVKPCMTLLWTNMKWNIFSVLNIHEISKIFMQMHMYEQGANA